MRLDDQCILITGATGLLGTQVTKAFLHEGARVAGVSRTTAVTDFVHEQYVAIAADTGQPDGARGAFDQAVKACGRVDCVIHLVGGFASGPRVEDTTTADIDRMFSLNLHSAWTLARVAMPRFRQQGFGRFAAVASRVVEEPVPLTSAYAASKAALVALMRTLDAEGLEAGIRAKVLLPPTLDSNVIREVTGELLEFATR